MNAVVTHDTNHPSSKKQEKTWHLIDAQDQPLGRLASGVAILLMGKQHPAYSAHLDCGDDVVIINSDLVAVTGRKEDQKIYYRHSGYPGGLTQRTLGELRQRDSRKIISEAVRGMLPKNKLTAVRLAHLHIYNNEQHPHQAQLSSRKGASK